MDTQNMTDLNDLEMIRVPFIVKDIDKMIRTHKISSDDGYTLLKSNKDDNASVKILIVKADDYTLLEADKDKKASSPDYIKVDHSPYFICPSCGEKCKQLYYPTEIVPEVSREWLCKDCTCDPSIFKYGNVVYNAKQIEEYKKTGIQKPLINIVAIDEDDLAVQSR